MIHEETIQKLIDLKLHAMAAAARELANGPPRKDITAEELLGMIVDREQTHRDNRKLTRRLKEAKLSPIRLDDGDVIRLGDGHRASRSPALRGRWSSRRIGYAPAA